MKMDKNSDAPKQDPAIRESVSAGTNSLLNPAAATFTPGYPDSSTSLLARYRQGTLPAVAMPPSTDPAIPSSLPHRPQHSTSPAPAGDQISTTMVSAPNPQLQILPLVPRRPALALPPFVPPTIPPIQPNPSTANNIARLAQYAHPHYTTYPLNRSFTGPAAGGADLYPTQPQRPPVLVPNHPVFVYYGRDLSSPQLPLPRHYEARSLFYRIPRGNLTDEGFGPGVFVHPVVQAEVAEAERANMELIVRWDRQRLG